MNYKLLIIALSLLHVVTNISWLAVNNAPPTWDAANHTIIALKIADNIRSFDFLGVLQSSEYYPIFVHTLGALISFVTADIKVLQGIGTLFFILAIVSLYQYSKLLFGSRIAFYTASIFSFFPIVFGESRRFMLDLPLTAILIVSLYLLEKSNNLSNRKFSVFFFIALGLLLMTKWTGLIFIAVPLTISLVKAVKTNGLSPLLKNSLLGLPITLVIALPWYVTNLTSFYSFSQIYVEAYADQPANLFSAQNFLYYFKLFTNLQVTPLISLVFLASLFSIFRKISHKWIFAFMGLSYAFFTLLSNKDPRYLMPLLPFSAIIIALGLEEFNKRFKYASRLVLIFLLIYFVLLSLRPAVFENLKLSLRLPIVDWINFVDVSDSLVRKYNTNTWDIDSLLDDLEGSKAIIALEDEYINPSTLNLYLIRRSERKTQLESPDIAYMLKVYKSSAFPDEKDLEEYIKSSDLLLISPLNLGYNYLRNEEALTQIQHYFVAETLLPCANFETKVAPRNTTCYVRMGEILESVSDFRINDSPDDKVGLKTLSDFTKVRCPYACSFRQIKAPRKRFDINLIKEYRFPNGLRLQLYKV